MIESALDKPPESFNPHRMQIQFLGATRTTTGSQYLLEVNGQRILMECGLFQGHREEMTSRNCCFQFDPAKIDCAILSHAHIDHCGNFPNLYRQGFRGNIYCTSATRDLASIMLVDSGKIQQADAQFVSKHRAKKGLPPVEPLYSLEDAEAVTRQFVSFDYNRPLIIADGVTVTFKDAGHILARRKSSSMSARTGANSATSSPVTSVAAMTTSCAILNPWRTWTSCRWKAPTATAITWPNPAATKRSWNS